MITDFSDLYFSGAFKQRHVSSAKRKDKKGWLSSEQTTTRQDSDEAKSSGRREGNKKHIEMSMRTPWSKLDVMLLPA